jgi:hypothetical protein
VKTVCFSHFYIKNEHFAKTALGTNIGKTRHQQQTVFLQTPVRALPQRLTTAFCWNSPGEFVTDAAKGLNSITTWRHLGFNTIPGVGASDATPPSNLVELLSPANRTYSGRNVYAIPPRLILGGRPVLSAHLNVETTRSERNRPNVEPRRVLKPFVCDFLDVADPDIAEVSAVLNIHSSEQVAALSGKVLNTG